MNPEEARKALLEAILTGNRAAANQLIDSWAGNTGYRNAFSELLEPVLENIGTLWSSEKICLAAGYLAGKIAEDTLHKIIEREEAHPELKGPVVIGNVEDDYHLMGRKFVGIFLGTAGWRVIDLGSDVQAEEFVDAAVANGARIIGASAMMFVTAENIKKIRTEIDRRGLSGKIKLAVGGAVFKIRPELVAEVGGDGTAANAVDAPRLFERLWPAGDEHDLS